MTEFGFSGGVEWPCEYDFLHLAFKCERNSWGKQVKQWHLIQFKPNSHRLAERNLKRQDFEVFLPMQEITRRKASSSPDAKLQSCC